MLNGELEAWKWIALVSTAHSKCSIAVREECQLKTVNVSMMCHAPVALDVTVADFVPDT